jgi:hypothetical protein
MLQRLTRYAAALLVLGSACAIYQFAFVAWLEPAPLEPIEFAQTPGLRRNEAIASLFPADAWQVRHCKRLQTRDGVLLFENWQQIGDDQWKLWPLTLVMGINSESPLILDAQQGAEIKFSEALDMMSGGAPPIERGRMIGPVRIKSVGKAISLGELSGRDGGGNEGHLEILSSDFGIDFRKIWTTQPIVVRLGNIKLVGRDLTLHLAPVSRIQQNGEGAISILDRMELIYLDDLTVPLPEGGLWGSGAARVASKTVANTVQQPLAQRLPTPGDGPPPPATAKLRCADRVVFLFGTHELTLRGKVQLEHRTSRATDVFECEQLKMQFTNLFDSRPRSDASGRADEIGDYLISVVAEGSPARMRLPSFTAEIAAELIDFDARAGLLQMSGRAGARISYAGHTWKFKQFSYQLNPSEPTEIGAFDALGSGLVEFAGPTELPVKRLRWSDGVKLEQPRENGEFSLRVDGNVTALMNDGGEFTCDSALLVLLAGSKEIHGDQWLRSTQPKRFQATGRVAMKSPMVDVATRLLQVYFDFETPAQPLHHGNATGSTGMSTADSVAAHPMRQWVRQPNESGGSSGIAGQHPKGTAAVPAANSSPVLQQRPTILGETINAKLRLTGNELTATDLSVVGNVSVTHSVETPGGPLPAVLTGDRLQLRDTAGAEVLQIGSGIESPAKMTLGDGFFIGPLIQIRLADNIVWIKEAGKFQIPSQMLPQGGAMAARLQSMQPIHERATSEASTSPTPPGTLRWVSAPHCRWRGQMLFNGSRALLTDGVDIRGAVMIGTEQDVWDIDLVGDQLEVVLDQEVQMRQFDTVRTATVEHVTITSSAAHPLVVTANQLTSRGVRKARHILSTPELTLWPETAMLKGTGPGWYRAWVQTETAPMSSGVTSGGFRPGEAAISSAHLVFQELLEANLTQQSLDFIRGVRIASRPVKSWDELVDVEAIHGLRMGESTLDCDRLRLGIDPTQPRGFAANAWELEAIGGVLFQTRNDKGLFNGTAHRASYAAAKDTFLIEGEPGRSASLSRTLPTGAPGGSVWGNATVNTRTMEVKNFELNRLQLGTLPNLSR